MENYFNILKTPRIDLSRSIDNREKRSNWMKRSKEEEEEDDDSDEEGAAAGGRWVAAVLRKRQLEESGRQRWGLAARVLLPGQQDGFKFIVKHRHPVTAVALSKDSDKGFSASKDGVILHWDVETGKSEKYSWQEREGVGFAPC